MQGISGLADDLLSSKVWLLQEDTQFTADVIDLRAVGTKNSKCRSFNHRNENFCQSVEITAFERNLS